jgi:hypothetical protein
MCASARLIEAALKNGITHFDTAPSYGSEEVLGAVLARMPDVTIATKVGVARSTAERSASQRIIGPLYRATFRPLLARMPGLKSTLLRRHATATAIAQPQKTTLHRDTVLRELEESLRSLRRSAIDIYLIHEPDAIELTDELREVFLSLHRSGVIKAFGLAFGGAPSPQLFGQIVQCRYESNLPPPDNGSVRVFHGVVRSGMQTRRVSSVKRDASTMIQEALACDPHAAVIFSASTRRQLTQISQSVNPASHNQSRISAGLERHD